MCVSSLTDLIISELSSRREGRRLARFGVRRIGLEYVQNVCLKGF